MENVLDHIERATSLFRELSGELTPESANAIRNGIYNAHEEARQAIKHMSNANSAISDVIDVLEDHLVPHHASK